MKSLFAWPGGKHRLLKTLLGRIPEHHLYVEVFAGSAKLLFAKEPSAAEVVNDLNGDIANFYRVVKHRSAELAERLEGELLHPDRFRELRVDEPYDEIERALRFAYLTWYSYGSKGEHYAHVTLPELLQNQRRRPLDKVREAFLKAAERLSRVHIEQRDFAHMLHRFDTPETFFYLDPPYVHFGNVARYDALTIERREELFSLLAKVKGSFLLSFDDCLEVRDLAAKHGFEVESVQTRYGLGHTTESRGQLSELLMKRAA